MEGAKELCLNDAVRLAQPKRLAFVPEGASRFVRYCVVGGAGAVVNMAVLWWIRSGGILGTLRAAVVAIECGIISSFLCNETWTFQDRSRLRPRLRNRLWRFGYFNLICGTGAIVHLAVLWTLAINWRWYYLVSNAVAMGAVLPWNYGMNTLWTWARPPQGPA